MTAEVLQCTRASAAAGPRLGLQAGAAHVRVHVRVLCMRRGIPSSEREGHGMADSAAGASGLHHVVSANLIHV